MSSGIFLLLDVNMPLRRKRLERAAGSSCLPVKFLQTEMFVFDRFGCCNSVRSELLATSSESVCVRQRARADEEELQERSSAEKGAHGARPYSPPVDKSKKILYTIHVNERKTLYDMSHNSDA